MPVKSSTNNRIIPANARASDVAAKAVKEIMAVQQARNLSAMRVQGYAAILYTHLKQGRKCTCQSSQKHLSSRLGFDGKAKPGVINELLTGQKTFDVTPYGSVMPQDDPFSNVVSPDANNKYQGVFDVAASDPSDSQPARTGNGDIFGDNGPLNADFDIETLVGDFDASHLGLTDATCGVCFGHGFVGGYAPFSANRTVLTVDDVDLQASTIDFTKHPWSAESESFSFTTVLPYGALGVDSFRLLNNHLPVAANFTIDGNPADLVSVLKYCDGKSHQVVVTLPRSNEWTHVELQFVTSDQSAFFEFPKLNKGSDTSLIEQLDPFSIIMSSNVPSLQSQDIIVESTFGKTLVVQNSSWWNDRDRNVLGWECQVRVIQPQELYGILPRRGRILTKNRTTVFAHDNQTGNYRT